MAVPTAYSFMELALQSALKQRHIAGLDAVRATAILLVLALHFGICAHGTGSLGVMIFFVLSGFLITRLLLAEHAKTHTISLREFYKRRAFRIFPAFYACWIVETILLALHGQHTRWWEPWASFFYLENYARAFAGPETIGHMQIAWSLAIEEQFYLIWPAVLLWLLRRSKPTIKLVSLFVLAIWLYRAFLFLGLHLPWSYIYNAFDTRIDALMIGSLLGLMTYSASGLRVLQPLVKSAWLGAFPVLMLAASLLLDDQLIKSPWLNITSFTLQPVIIAVLLIQCVYFGMSAWQFIRYGLLQFIAKISYSLYLCHALVLSEVARLNLTPLLGNFQGMRLLDIDGHLRLALVPIPAIAASILSYYCVERPFMMMRDSKRAAASSRRLADATAEPKAA